MVNFVLLGGRMAIAGCLLLFALPGTAQAATLRVPCSADALVAAINIANGTVNADSIELSHGCTYTLAMPNNAANGLPLISSEMTINGRGATITRDRSAPAFRVLAVADTGTLTLVAATISGVKAATDCGEYPGAICGGGIYNGGTLTVKYSRVIDNVATGTPSSDPPFVEGAGIDNDGTATVVRARA